MKSDNIFGKTIDVIRSCETKEQLAVAKKYAALADKILEYTATFLFYNEIEKHSKKIN
jgi:hypothetical protein